MEALVEGHLRLPTVLPLRPLLPARQARGRIVALLGGGHHDGAMRGTACACGPATMLASRTPRCAFLDHYTLSFLGRAPARRSDGPQYQHRYRCQRHSDNHQGRAASHPVPPVPRIGRTGAALREERVKVPPEPRSVGYSAGLGSEGEKDLYPALRTLYTTQRGRSIGRMTHLLRSSLSSPGLAQMGDGVPRPFLPPLLGEGGPSHPQEQLVSWWSTAACVGTTRSSNASSGGRCPRATGRPSPCSAAAGAANCAPGSTRSGASSGRALWRLSYGRARRPENGGTPSEVFGDGGRATSHRGVPRGVPRGPEETLPPGPPTRPVPRPLRRRP